MGVGTPLFSYAKVTQFDEMETHEHSKWKPLSICLFVNQDRKILGFRFSSMSARGRDAAQARKKYGSHKAGLCTINSIFTSEINQRQ